MEQKELNKIEELLQSSKWLSLPVFEQYIDNFVKRKADSKIALQELDGLIGSLQNHILSLSLFIKQNFLIGTPAI